jgi:hypothetical protein
MTAPVDDSSQGALVRAILTVIITVIILSFLHVKMSESELWAMIGRFAVHNIVAIVHFLTEQRAGMKG